MKGSLVPQLENLGLNEKEAKVYLAALEAGPVSIASLVRKARIKRPTLYYILESLTDKGLMMKLPHGKRVLYRAEKPKKFARLLDTQYDVYRSILPQLEATYGATFTLPTINLYEGKEGLVTAYEQMFSTSRVVYGLVSADEYFSIFSHDENARFFNLLRESGGYLYYDMFLYSEHAPEFKRQSYRKGVSRTKVLPSSFTGPVDIMTTGECVIMVSFKNLVAVLIDDRAIAQSQKELLQFLWKTA